MNLGSAYYVISMVPLDWIVIGAFFVIVAVDALRSGSVRACALALSFPLASILFQITSQTAGIGSVLTQFSGLVAQAVIFLIIEVVVFVCLHRMLMSYDRYKSFLSATVSGFAATVVVLTIWVQLPSLQSLWHFSPQIQHIFGSSYRFFWIIAAYLALAFVGS